MSIILPNTYPGRANPVSVDYPQGSVKNKTSPTATDGTPLDEQWANDKEGFFQSLLVQAGVTANGNIDKVGDSQYFDALKALQNISVWSNSIDYSLPYIVFGSDGNAYQALLASGPSTTPRDPVSSPTYWKPFAVIATQAEVNAGTDDQRIVTPLKLKSGFAASFTANGYIKLPTWLGGLIFQWGLVTTSGGSATIFFPLSFGSGGAYSVIASANAANLNRLVSTGTITPSSFPVYVFNASANTNTDATINWFAVGRS